MTESELRTKCEALAPHGDAMATAVLRLFEDHDRVMKLLATTRRGILTYPVSLLSEIDIKSIQEICDKWESGSIIVLPADWKFEAIEGDFDITLKPYTEDDNRGTNSNTDPHAAL